MATRQGRSEVPDSEDEPMTSSPTNTFDEAVDKLFTMAPAGPTPGAQHLVNCTHQACTQRDGYAVSDQAENLRVDRNIALVDVDESKFGQTIMQPNDATVQEGTIVEANGHRLDPNAVEASLQPACNTSSIPAEHETSMMRTMETDRVANATADEYSGEQSTGTIFNHEPLAPNEKLIEAMFDFVHDDSEQQASSEAMHSEIGGITKHGCHLPQLLHFPDIAPNDINDAQLGGQATRGEAAVPGTEDDALESESTTHTINDVSVSLPKHNPFQEHRSREDKAWSATDLTTHLSRPEPLAPTPARPTHPKTPQEITLAELKAQKATLLATLATLPALQVLIEEIASSQAELSDDNVEPTEVDIMGAANKIVKDHIKLLHEYNELKDVGQGLMGLLADQRGVRILEVQEEFGIDGKD
ncbi:uncharacterized protein K460DRAFT_361682 [Cucurbitaria berberidis CBS 394.84]|uniref:Swi5-domain-containing protein n=1 Tax=Cucurbitaria berberidis CBS 394.84 TaxID=1168544 RepID=A0A9P4LDK5_9PLEO|nr:uncharacterized protein K460DRAFT_361682 [Cucurbitaria berberidis CBS 394.84]KAF1850928.1 hypothetical protein K460DRAFT_361682 [Cucurbitaria berberidis CBS 394.84]